MVKMADQENKQNSQNEADQLQGELQQSTSLVSELGSIMPGTGGKESKMAAAQADVSEKKGALETVKDGITQNGIPGMDGNDMGMNPMGTMAMMNGMGGQPNMDGSSTGAPDMGAMAMMGGGGGMSSAVMPAAMSAQSLSQGNIPGAIMGLIMSFASVARGLMGGGLGKMLGGQGTSDPTQSNDLAGQNQGEAAQTQVLPGAQKTTDRAGPGDMVNGIVNRTKEGSLGTKSIVAGFGAKLKNLMGTRNLLGESHEAGQELKTHAPTKGVDISLASTGGLTPKFG